jgi:glycosyltransferase involved in cell wall biosynthesis
MTAIRFSIITICKNAEDAIGRTMNSVLSQSYQPIQYIVIDGASSDKTCEIVRRYENRISCFVSEKDHGVYEAMNKGIGFAEGDLLLFLNAGDVLFNTEVLSHVNAVAKDSRFKDVDVFHGKLVMYYEKTGDGYLWESGPYGRFAAYRGSLPHPATFYTKNAFEKNGVFDQSYKISGDYEWVVRGVMKNQLKFQYMELVSAVFYQGGLSSSPEFSQDQRKEIKRLIARHYSPLQRASFLLLNRTRKILGL